MLGEIITRLDGGSWAQSLQRRLLEPLELRRTTLQLHKSHSAQSFLPPYTDAPCGRARVD